MSQSFDSGNAHGYQQQWAQPQNTTQQHSGYQYPPYNSPTMSHSQPAPANQYSSGAQYPPYGGQYPMVDQRQGAQPSPTPQPVTYSFQPAYLGARGPFARPTGTQGMDMSMQAQPKPKPRTHCHSGTEPAKSRATDPHCRASDAETTSFGRSSLPNYIPTPSAPPSMGAGTPGLGATPKRKRVVDFLG